MGTEQEIAEGLLSLFRETNPSSFNSLNQLILRLQSKLGFDLSDKIEFIRSQINSIFSQPAAQPQPPLPQQQQLQQLPSPSSLTHPLPSPVNPKPPTTSNPSSLINPNLSVSYPTPTPTPTLSNPSPKNPHLDVSYPNPNTPNLNVSYPTPTPTPRNPNNPNLNVSYPNPSNPNLNVLCPSPDNPNLNVSYPSPSDPNNPNLNVPYPSLPSNPNLNVSYPNASTAPDSPNPCNRNLKVSYRPNNIPHHPHAVKAEQHVFHGQSHFPKGPTEICFGQPDGGTVVTDFTSTPPAKDSSQKPKRRGGSGGLNKLCGVTPQLQAIVGQPTMPRTEIVKQLWAYIRKNNLQDPSNKRKIICNDELRLVFEVDCTDMFQMNKLLAKHILPLDSTIHVLMAAEDSGQQSKKLKAEESKPQILEPTHIVTQSKKLKVEESLTPIPELTHIVISEGLANFFGTTEMKMLQSDVYKRIEEYIKREGLVDSSNSMVICDPKLQELLGCETITASAVRDALARNLSNQQA